MTCIHRGKGHPVRLYVQKEYQPTYADLKTGLMLLCLCVVMQMGGMCPHSIFSQVLGEMQLG